MSKFKQILKELAGTALNVPDGELTALLEKTEEEIDVNVVAKTLKDKYRDNLNAFAKNQKDEGFKAAERSVSKKFEDALKTSFDISSDKQGEELISEIRELTKAKPPKGAGLSDDDIKKTDTYLRMEKLFKEQAKSSADEFQKKIDSLNREYGRKETFSAVSKKIFELFEREGYFFDEDAGRAANKKNDLISKFESYDYETKGDDVIIMKDGKVLENEYGHRVEFNDFVNNLTGKFYAKKVTDKRQSPNSGSDNQGRQNGYSGVIPKTAEEFDMLMSDPSIPGTDKLAIIDKYEKMAAV